MKRMESYLQENFDVKSKNSSEDTLRKWRDAVGVVKNPKRRFRHTANIVKRNEAAAMKRTIKEKTKLRVAMLVSRAAVNFMLGVGKQDYAPPSEVVNAGFQICADELGSIVEAHDVKNLITHGGIDGIAKKLSTSITTGIINTQDDISQRQQVFGFNKFTETPSRSFWVFVWEALQDMTLMILGLCAFVSLVVGITTEGWPKGAHDGLGIVASILLVVFVTATSDYRQSLQFKDLDKEKKKISIQVTRNGLRQKISIYDIVAGDLVHLGIGDQVPADGLFISGFSLQINESSLTGEPEPVMVNSENRFLLSGTKVQDGSCKMMVTTVGMNTQWGKLMATLSEGGDDETPLQVKLNGVATIIGKIGLFFAIVTFAVLAQGLFSRKFQTSYLSWSMEDVLELLEYFAVAVTIVVVAVPEGLPLAVTLSLAFAMKKMMNDKALVRHLAACETMGSATNICSDKTGTLTTNHMSVVKTCIFGDIKEIKDPKDAIEICSKIPEFGVKLLMQSIFMNTGGDVVTNKDGKREILGTPTETAILELGLSLGQDFTAERDLIEIIKVEPFNSAKKRMGVVIKLTEGGTTRVHCKGASEIILAACDKYLDSNGNTIPLDESTNQFFTETINGFANEALRTLCLAYMEIDGNFPPNDNIPLTGFTCIGIVGIKDPVRPGVKESVAICRSAGITVRMVTGDNINTAKAIARECGILTDDGIAIEGPKFRELELKDMFEIIPKIQVIARSSPMDKHTMVKHLRTTFNEVVAVTGDGTNDAPALHEADIGLAMGIAGTEVAKESADVIILDDNFSTIVTVAKWGRSVYVNIQKFVQFQLTVNIVALIVNFSSACLTGSAPLTAVQLLWVNMIMDTLGALALATEPPNGELMKRMPVGRTGKFISNVMWRNIIGQSIYQFIVIWILQADGTRLFQLSGSDNADRILNTLIFNSFVFCQVFNEISSREMEKINVFEGILENYVFVAVISSTAIFQIIIVQFLGDFANTYPLSLLQWFVCVIIGFLSMPIAAVIKLFPVGSN
ncbi:Calcium-transporting ATPase 1 [Zostera marina]|uniref:Calcium-transporting ATPase n=1 Tax=Zostera marina TaxID=29655 RepID=A0A0K9NZQ0_ZOSMR|nr:Calcium-transporting ATPase 1 [Zostera marina]